MTDPTHICCGSGFPLPNTTSPTLIGTLAFPSVLDGEAYYYDASGIFSGTATRYRIVTGEMGSGIVFNETTCVFSGTASGTTDLEGISIAAEDAESLSETSNTATLVIGTTLTIPIWIEPITFTWVVGDYIYEPIANFIENPDPDDEYLLFAGTWPVAVSVVDGIIVGTIAALQGGTYTPELSAENALGISYTTVTTEVLVALPPEAPVLATPADIATGLLEEGSTYQFTLTSTNPESNTLFYELEANQVVFDTITVNGFTGVVDFIIAAGQDGVYATVTYKVTDTVTALSSTAFHSVTIDVVSGNAETPQLGGFYSGALYCETAVVAPTWTDGPYSPAVAAISDSTTKSIDVLSEFLLANGGAAVDLVELSTTSEALPPDWSFQLTAGGPGIGFLTRTADTNTVAESRTLSFRASNDAGSNWSAISPDLALTFFDDTATAPTITGISAEEGTNDVFVQFDDDIHTVADTAASYVLDFLFQVNPVIPAVYRTPTYIVGGGTSTLQFELDGAAFTADNTIRWEFTNSTSDLRSVGAEVQVPAKAEADYVVPENYVPQPGGWTIVKNFEAGVVGANAQGDGIGFDGDASESYYRSSPTKSGNRSIECNVLTSCSASGCWSKWGGSFSFPSNVEKDQEIWYRLYAYFPVGFSFSTPNSVEGVKFMRIHCRNANGSNAFFHHNFIKSYDSDQGIFIMGGEVIDEDGFTIGSYLGDTTSPLSYDPWPHEKQRGTHLGGGSYEGLAKVKKGQWHCFEEYIKFNPAHGLGIRRSWVDGNLVFEDRETGTLHDDGDSDYIYQFTYWNGGVPQDQKCYIDSVVITTATPSGRDDDENPFIGL